MGFEHRFRLSAHAVITDAHNHVLLLQATYGDLAWGLPGGGVDPGETLHETLLRECEEELSELTRVQRTRVEHCLNFDGNVKSQRF